MADPEVLSLILGNGCRGVCALELAREILTETGGLTGLAGMRPDTLQRRGLGEAKAAAVLAALELARRLAQSQVPRRRPMENPFRVVRYLALRYGVRDQEVMGALFLDVRNRLLGEGEIVRGTLSRALVEPRQVLWPALARGAAGVVIFHNHPSGDPTPSLEDREVTRRLARAGRLLGIPVLDHVVVAEGGFASLREEGGFDGLDAERGPLGDFRSDPEDDPAAAGGSAP